MNLIRSFLILAPVALAVWACDDDDDNNHVDRPTRPEVDAGLEGMLSCLAPGYVAWCEDALPTVQNTAESKDFFPLTPNATWRFREQAADVVHPPEATVGSEMTVKAGANANQFVRQTVAYLDLPVGGDTVRAVQIMRETYDVVESRGLLGPQVQLSKFELEEHEVEGLQRKIRAISRSYDPPYKMIADSWHVNDLEQTATFSDISISQDSWYFGQTEPTHAEGTVDIKVVKSANPEILAMEGRYREDVYRMDFYDDFGGQLVRSMWLQSGVGPVQWRSPETNNTTFTLIKSNVEAEP